MRTASGAHQRTSASRKVSAGLKLLVPLSVVLALLFATLDFARADEVPTGKTLKTLTVTQLEGYISRSAAVGPAPNLMQTTPPLQYVVSDGLTLPMTHACYADGKSLAKNPATQCLWGDKKATKSIFLFGDSQAASWLSAFNQIGMTNDYKVYLLAEASCPPWEPAGTSNFTLSSGMTIDQCIAVRAKEVAFANSIHPAMIVLAGDTNEISNGDWNTTPADYETEMAAVVSSLKPSRSKIVLLSEVPQYNVTATDSMTPTTCLTVHGKDVIPCLLTPQFVLDSGLSQGLISASAKIHIPLINILPLFCTGQRCPLTVTTPAGTFLTHYDQYHMSKFYSKYIAPALMQLMASAFK